MQLRVVSDQPWDVKADVLAVPIVGEPAFDGPAGRARSANRRRAPRPGRRSASCGRSATPRRSRRRARSRRAASSTLSAGDADGARPGDGAPRRRRDPSPPRRPPGEDARDLAEPARATLLEGGADAVAELVARGVVEGGFDPQVPLPRRRRDGSAGARRADPHRPGRGHGVARSERRSAESSSARARTTPGPCPIGRPTTSARRSSPTRPGPSPRSTACGST